MPSFPFAIDPARCTSCGACVRDCPGAVLNLPDSGTPIIPDGADERCIACQHCLAVCPTGALSIFGLDPTNSLPLTSQTLPSFAATETLIRGRRSIRQFRQENVERSLLERLLKATAHAPTGCNCRNLTFALVDDRAAVDRLREKIMGALTVAHASGRLEQTPDFLWEAVIAWRERKEDHIFRGAPHVLLIHTKEGAVCTMEDAVIALANFDLLAQSAGVGTVWLGYLRFVLDTLPELRELFGIPAGAGFYPMLFGYPAVQYARTVQRDGDAHIVRVAI